MLYKPGFLPMLGLPLPGSRQVQQAGITRKGLYRARGVETGYDSTTNATKKVFSFLETRNKIGIINQSS